jgi:hypothetical protein
VAEPDRGRAAVTFQGAAILLGTDSGTAARRSLLVRPAVAAADRLLRKMGTDEERR